MPVAEPTAKIRRVRPVSAPLWGALRTFPLDKTTRLDLG